MEFKVENRQFLKDGRPFFVISGEIHYFRLESDLWEKHLTLLKETGANTTSTYVPWDWHEYEEGRLDFTGETHPSRNLLGYISLCKKVGLNLILKPGPYILAEYENQGLPGWLLEKCSKEAFATDEKGNSISLDLLTYMSAEFLHYSFLWYDRIMPIIAQNQCGNGGPVIMMQVCNEIGVFQWLSGKIDYNPAVKKLYAKFLIDRYATVENLNAIYGTQYECLEKVEPPVGIIENKQDYDAYYDFHLFYRHYYAKYFDVLVKRIKSYGIDVQLTHNIPGWIFGNAAELPMLMSTYSEVLKTRKDIIFGMDHIPEFVSYRNAHSDLACNKILEALQTYGPAWAAEFQAGTREHHVRNYASDMEMFYFASLAHGLRGFNYYMFSQGTNLLNKGFFGKTFYYQTALDYKAETLPLFNTIKKVGTFINEEHDNLLQSGIKSEIAIGLYKPYFFTELVTSQMLKEKRLFIEKLNLYLDPRFVREEIMFNGLMRSLQTLSLNYDVCDLEQSSMDKLLVYKQLWVASTEFMDRCTQSLLADYVKRGGHLVIYPAIPTMDNYLNECNELSTNLGLNIETALSPNKVDAFGIEDVYTYTQKKQKFNVTDEEILASTKNGEACGVRKKVEKGWILALGFAFGYSSDEHLNLYGKIVSLDGIKSEIQVSDPDIQFVLRRGEKYSYLFLFNYHNEHKTFYADSEEHELGPYSSKVEKFRRM